MFAGIKMINLKCASCNPKTMSRRRTPAHEIFVVGDLDQLLKELPADHKFRKWVGDMKVVLKEHMFAGELIGKKLVPAFYIERYGVNNLYRYDHPEGHRSCYTIAQGCVYIIDIMSHSEYDLRFWLQDNLNFDACFYHGFQFRVIDARVDYVS